MTAKTIVGFLVALTLTIYPGYFHGLKYFRWGKNERVEEIAARLKSFPEEFHGWEKVGDQKMTIAEFEMLRPIEYLSRRFKRGESMVQLFVMLGPTGPTAVHTPDICFSSRDYSTIGSRQRLRIDSNGNSTSDCWECAFQSRNFNDVYLKSWYAWTTDGNWQAAENPRYSFAQSSYLLKIQVEAIYPDQQSLEQSQDAENFLRDVQSYIKDNVLN